MKNGYKHMTGVFGSDAEMYVSNLLGMARNPNGHRRPDLISKKSSCEPKLSIEVKSGLKNKGVMVDYQLVYAVSLEEDYIEEELSPRQSFFPFETHSEPVAYYYDLISRVDGLKSNELDRPFSSIKIEWGNQHLVPGDLGFFSFAVCRALRTGEDVNVVIKYLKTLMGRDFREGTSNYYKRKEDSNSWQDLHGSDILALFHRDVKYTSNRGAERVRLIAEHYPEVESLKRIEIPGPNGTKIYIMAEPQHEKVFSDLREVIEQNTPSIELISERRNNARSLLDKIEIKPSGQGLIVGKTKEKVHYLGKLENEEIRELRKLIRWEK